MTVTPPVAGVGKITGRLRDDTALRDKTLVRSDLPRAPKIGGQLSLEGLEG